MGLFNKAVEVSPAGLLSAVNVTTPPYAPRTVLAGQGMQIAIPNKTPNVAGATLVLNTASSTKAKATWTGVQTFGDDVVVTINGTTAYGKQRIADGHPDKFDVRFFELGKPVTVQYYNVDVTMTLEQKNAMPPIDTVQQRG